MLETFVDTINTQDFCETGFIEILSVQQRKNTEHLNIALMLQMATLSEPGLEMTEYWRLDLEQVQANSISLGYPRHIHLSQEHCLLWCYQQPIKSVVIPNPLEETEVNCLLSRWYCIHQERVGTWIPFKISKDKLLRGGYVIAQAPETLILDYQTVLDEMEIDYSAYVSDLPLWYDSNRGWVEEKKDFQILTFDSSYVVAAAISAKCFSTRYGCAEWYGSTEN